MRVLICGSRRWHDRQAISDRLWDLVIDGGYRFPEPTIVHGAAQGADRIAGEEAGKAGLLVEEHPADWERHGKRAGIIRNLEMLDSGIDLVIAFHDGRSTGTAHTIAEARRRGIPVEVHGGAQAKPSTAAEGSWVATDVSEAAEAQDVTP